MDIIDRENILAKLYEKEAELVTLINNTDDMICSRDHNRALITWNNAFGASIKAAFGVEPYVGMRTVDYLSSDQRKDFDRFSNLYSRVLAGEKIRDEFSYRLPTGKVQYYEIAWSPIRSGNEIKGVAEVTRNITDRKMKENDLHKLAGRLITNQEEELRRLARELHDDLTQQLAVMAIEAGNIEAEKGLPESVIMKVMHIKDQLIKASRSVHNLSRDLHPSIIEDLGLERAVRSECNNFSSRTGIAVIFTPDNIPEKISIDTALSLYRIIQEGLTNIYRHAKTKNAYVFLEGIGDHIHLVVRDTGVGFDPGDVRVKAALGLGSMRERVRLVNGEFAIMSSPGKGTSVEVKIPLKGD